MALLLSDIHTDCFVWYDEGLNRNNCCSSHKITRMVQRKSLSGLKFKPTALNTSQKAVSIVWFSLLHVTEHYRRAIYN